ncbi:MAG TPA: hypothetical protein VF816_10030 [Rhodocyclaceae bacterium]
MATRTAPSDLLLCPNCGQPMLTVEITLAGPPFVVELAGCEHCGITSNEFADSEPAPAGGALVRDYRRR